MKEANSLLVRGNIYATSLSPNVTTRLQKEKKDIDDISASSVSKPLANRSDIGKRGGVVVSLLGPQYVDKHHPSLKYMNPLSECREVVIVLIIPHALLFSLKFISPPPVSSTAVTTLPSSLLASMKSPPESQALKYLRVLPIEALEALMLTKVMKNQLLGGSRSLNRVKSIQEKVPLSAQPSMKESSTSTTKSGSTRQEALVATTKRNSAARFVKSKVRHGAVGTLTSRCVIRAYQLKDDAELYEQSLVQSDAIKISLHAVTPTSRQSFDGSLRKNDSVYNNDEIDSDDDNDDGDDDNGDKALSKVENGGVVVEAIKNNQNNSIVISKNKRERRNVVSTLKTVTTYQVSDIQDYIEQLNKARNSCADYGLVPLYYYTSAEGSDSLMASGFKMLNEEGADGVYFSTKGPCYYGLGTPEYEKNLIVDTFGYQKLDGYLGQGKLDLVLVYGADPCCVESLQNTKSKAKLIGKHLFEDLSLPAKDGQYYLRPDRIKAALLVNSKSMKVGKKSKLKSVNDKNKTVSNDPNIENNSTSSEKEKIFESKLKNKYANKLLRSSSSKFVANNDSNDLGVEDLKLTREEVKRDEETVFTLNQMEHQLKTNSHSILALKELFANKELLESAQCLPEDNDEEENDADEEKGDKKENVDDEVDIVIKDDIAAGFDMTPTLDVPLNDENFELDVLDDEDVERILWSINHGGNNSKPSSTRSTSRFQDVDDYDDDDDREDSMSFSRMSPRIVDLSERKLKKKPPPKRIFEAQGKGKGKGNGRGRGERLRSKSETPRSQNRSPSHKTDVGDWEFKNDRIVLSESLPRREDSIHRKLEISSPPSPHNVSSLTTTTFDISLDNDDENDDQNTETTITMTDSLTSSPVTISNQATVVSRGKSTLDDDSDMSVRKRPLKRGF
jgi:hypothetical protein